jgi:hypothetical protein
MSKGEINKDFYCSNGRGMCTSEKHEGFDCQAVKSEMKGYCKYRKHKFPTPEQFQEEYGEGYPDDGAVYFRAWSHDHWTKWSLCFWGISDILGCKRGAQSSYPPRPSEDCQCVCACTPWGKPPDNWRPE